MISQIKQKGFTIVELLIVIVVIGILAAISIVAYNNVTQKARDDQRISDVRNIVNAFASYQSEEGEWPTAAELGAYKTVQLSGDQKTRLGTAAPSSTAKDVYQLQYCNGAGDAADNTAATGVRVFYWSEAKNEVVTPALSTGTCSA